MSAVKEKKRVFMCGFHQESNSFNPVLTSLGKFGITPSGEAGKRLYKSKTSSGGMVTLLEDAEDIEPIYSVVMAAYSGAPAQKEVTEYFLSGVLADIRAAGKLDGVAVSLHGATMSEDSDDVCGDILAAIRAEVGEEIPISASFDLHANITEKVAKSVDYICGFLEYPHIDQYETGYRAARILIDHLRGRKAKTARVTIPMIAPAHAYTTKSGALLELTSKAREMVSSGRIIDYTIFQVQPWLDAVEMATSIIVIADDSETAKTAATELAEGNFNIRRELQGEPLMSVEAVIEKALGNKSGKPIILVDSADSRGAGSTADSAEVIGKLLPYADRLSCAAGVTDAAAVSKAFEVGVGGRADFTLGATIAPELSSPVEIKDALVRSLHNGYFTAQGPINRGNVCYCGRSAVLQIGKMLIQVSTHSAREGDVGFYRGFGIEPTLCDLVSVKACTSFRAAYESIAAEICNTATAGAAGTCLSALPYKKRPTPLYPFEEISEGDISEAKIFR